MKKAIISAVCAMCLVLAFAGCNDKPPVEETPAIPIAINGNRVTLTNSHTTGNIRITSGNGGYLIIYPKHIFIADNETDYSEDVFHLRINDNNMVLIENRLSIPQSAYGYFMVQDHKGEKAIFEVRYTGINWVGGLFDPDGNYYDKIREEQMLRLLSNHDYWQW